MAAAKGCLYASLENAYLACLWGATAAEPPEEE